MTREGQAINTGGLHVDGVMSGHLGSIYHEQSTVAVYDFTDSRQIVERAEHVGRAADGHERDLPFSGRLSFVVLPQQVFEDGEADEPVVINVQADQFHAVGIAPGQFVGVVFHQGVDDDFRVVVGAMHGQQQFGQIDCLGGVAGEDGLKFIWRSMEEVPRRYF